MDEAAASQHVRCWALGRSRREGGRALTIFTVSDHIRTGEATSSDERQQTFDEMVEIALEAIKIDVARWESWHV